MLRGAIVGFGAVARHGHWPAYETSRDVQIVAVVDRTPGRRELAARLIPGVESFATLNELIGEGPQAVDFVDVCTPPAFHGGPIVAALDAGWHVICEKPLVLEAQEVTAIRERIAGRDLAVVPVHNWKHAPIIQRATELLGRGAIGTLRHLDFETDRTGSAVSAEDGGADWRRERRIAGGGILMDHGWHAIHLALDWFGGKPVSVLASLQWSSGGSVEDEAVVTLDFPQGSARIALTWNAPRRRNALTLVGDQGRLTLDDDCLRLDGVLAEQTRFPSPLSEGSHHPDWFADMLPGAVRALRQPGLARSRFEDAAACLAVIHAAYASAPVLSGAR